jgi:hypothetical protein
LAVAGFDHALADGGRVFRVGRRVASQIAKAHGGDVNVDVDAIQERPGDATDVALNLQRRAEAFAGWVVPESAGAPMRCPFVVLP